MGNTAQPHGLNTEGLRRRGFSADTIARLKRAYKTLYKVGHTLEEARLALKDQAADCAEVRQLLDFLSKSKRSIIR
jgi:UDP-N-acetylglucosamine acyltransferase